MPKITKTINNLIETSKIPASGPFEVSNSLIQDYITEYNSLFTKGVGLKTGDKSLARKLAGLNLLKLNFKRGVKYNQIRAGIVYIISNPSFPDHYKIGMTIDLEKRLAQYQTYDPYRSFMVVRWEFVTDRLLKEKEILAHPDLFKEQGEWVRKVNAIELFSQLIAGT